METAPAELKPWPTHAVIIVAARDEPRPLRLQSVIRDVCRECGEAVATTFNTYNAAWNHPAREGRPVDYLCRQCMLAYDLTTIGAVAVIEHGRPR